MWHHLWVAPKSEFMLEMLSWLAPRIFVKIAFLLDYESFKSCCRVNKKWKALLTSKSLQETRYFVFEEEIVDEERELQTAIEGGDSKKVKELLSCGVLDVNRLGDHDDGYGSETWIPLCHAADYDRREIANIMLELGADPNRRDQYGETPLHRAAIHGFAEMIQILVDKGADMEISEERGMTPSHFAALYNHRESVELLIRMGAQIEKTDRDGRTPLKLASEKRNRDVVQTLIEAGAVPFDQFYEWKLCEAADDGNIEEVKELLTERNLDINCAGRWDGLTPLHEAAIKGSYHK